MPMVSPQAQSSAISSAYNELFMSAFWKKETGVRAMLQASEISSFVKADS